MLRIASPVDITDAVPAVRRVSAHIDMALRRTAGLETEGLVVER